MHTKYSHLTTYEFCGLIAQLLHATTDPEMRDFIQEIINRLDSHESEHIENPNQRDLFK